MLSRSLLIFAVAAVCVRGVAAAEQDSSDKSSISRGAAAGILIALACTLTLGLLLLERRRKRKIAASRARFMESRPTTTPVPSRRASSVGCRNQPWRMSPSMRRDGDSSLFAPMDIVAPPPTYDAALKDKKPPNYKPAPSVASAAKSEPSIATRDQQGYNPC